MEVLVQYLKNLKRGSLNYFKLGGLKIHTKRLCFNPLMHSDNKRSYILNKTVAVSF